ERSAAGLESQGRSSGYRPMDGARSATTTARGASSGTSSLTMISADPRIDDSRAESFQSIRPGSSPGTYDRVVATLDPIPRRAARRRPKAEPHGRQRGA